MKYRFKELFVYEHQQIDFLKRIPYNEFAKHAVQRRFVISRLHCNKVFLNIDRCVTKQCSQLTFYKKVKIWAINLTRNLKKNRLVLLKIWLKSIF